MKIHTKWEGDILVVEASDHMKTSQETILRCHRNSSYGKLLGIEYSYFKTHGNHIACSFPQKIGPFTYSLTFEKVIERFPFGETRIYFKTIDSIANMNGVWTVQQDARGTLLSLTQETRVPAWTRMFPVKKIITSKIKKVFEEISTL
jgi:hypothetical protein